MPPLEKSRYQEISTADLQESAVSPFKPFDWKKNVYFFMPHS